MKKGRSRGAGGYAWKAFVVLSPAFYVGAWNLIIRYRLQNLIRRYLGSFTSMGSQQMARVSMGAVPEAVVWRMGVLPVYWSATGNLIPYHNLFALAYIFYMATSIIKIGRPGNFKLTRRLSSLDFNFIKKFWLALGVVAFLTTSLSTVVILADLISLIYYVFYLIALPMVPISLYLWGKKDRKSK